MKSLGWEAKSMPQVFWSVPVESCNYNPRIAEGMEAEVKLPNGQTVVVDHVRYQGTNGGCHNWQGVISMTGKASAAHTWFNCVACGTDICQIPKAKELFKGEQ